MVKKIYNVVLMSSIGNGITTSGETFFYDWSQIPDKPYKVSFTFYSSASVLNNTVGALLYVDLWQTYNQIATSQNSGSIDFRSSYLGCLEYLGTANNILFADSKTNPPSYLNGRPRTNNFIAQLMLNNGSFTELFYAVSNYVLTLYLEEI